MSVFEIEKGLMQNRFTGHAANIVRRGSAKAYLKPVDPAQPGRVVMKSDAETRKFDRRSSAANAGYVAGTVGAFAAPIADSAGMVYGGKAMRKGSSLTNSNPKGIKNLAGKAAGAIGRRAYKSGAKGALGIGAASVGLGTMAASAALGNKNASNRARHELRAAGISKAYSSMTQNRIDPRHKNAMNRMDRADKTSSTRDLRQAAAFGGGGAAGILAGTKGANAVNQGIANRYVNKVNRRAREMNIGNGKKPNAKAGSEIAVKAGFKKIKSPIPTMRGVKTAGKVLAVAGAGATAYGYKKFMDGADKYSRSNLRNVAYQDARNKGQLL